MGEIVTSIDVDAPPVTVWRVLTDFEAYPEWNPRLRIEGEPSEGERLTVTPGPQAGRLRTFHPRVTRAAATREFAWLGHLYVRGLYDGHHRFLIGALDDGRSHLVQSERARGLLAGPIERRYGPAIEACLDAVNRALAERAEALAAGDEGSPPDVTA